ncbi:hypothetical protein [Bifidobacterium choerinum]|uniref:hypothetical protein n=1 Tax=Bifidobacterium choerinum TaxID=35760 RepID=UPI003F9178E5
MAKYTREQRLRAVRLYEQYDRSATSVINELGYPSRPMLARWHRAWVEASRDDGRSLDDGRGERYTPEQKRAAVYLSSWVVRRRHFFWTVGDGAEMLDS